MVCLSPVGYGVLLTFRALALCPSSRLSSDTKVHDISAYCDIYSGG